MNKYFLVVTLPLLLCACDPDVDMQQTMAQGVALAEANAQVGMPAITNWQEKRMAKDIYEMRDKAISTHTYVMNEINGCLVYLGPSVGFGLPYATQYSAPTKQDAFGTRPQAEPNGLFMPDNAEGTWVMLKNPASNEVKPVYVESRVIVAPFRLINKECKE